MEISILLSSSTSGVRRLALLVLLLVLFPACEPARDESGPGTTLERIQREGVVRVGFASEAPYAYRDERTGQLTGEAIEIAKVVLERMGVQAIEEVPTDFAALIPGLRAERFDLIATGLFIQPDRCQKIDFSNPTFCVSDGLLVRADEPRASDLRAYSDLVTHGYRLGVVAGTVHLGDARKAGLPAEQIVLFPNPESAVEGLYDGVIDAYVGTRLTVRNLLNKAARESGAQPFAAVDSFAPAGREQKGCGAFGFRLADDSFREKFDQHLADFLGTQEHVKLIASFDFTEGELPDDQTADDLCS